MVPVAINLLMIGKDVPPVSSRRITPNQIFLDFGLIELQSGTCRVNLGFCFQEI